MEIKGVAVLSIPAFVRHRFPEDYDIWLSALDEPARSIMEGGVLTSSWYPVSYAMILPTKALCKLFYRGNPRGAWEAGRFSADLALSGVHKAFVKPGNPLALVDRAAGIFGAYYRPSTVVAKKQGDKKGVVRLLEFEDAHVLIEARMAGWMERALELCGCRNARVRVLQSLARGDTMTEFQGEWD